MNALARAPILQNPSISTLVYPFVVYRNMYVRTAGALVNPASMAVVNIHHFEKLTKAREKGSAAWVCSFETCSGRLQGRGPSQERTPAALTRCFACRQAEPMRFGSSAPGLLATLDFLHWADVGSLSNCVVRCFGWF